MEFEKLQGIIAEVLNIEPEDVTMAATFVDDLGADSLDIFQIIMGIEEEFDIEIPNEAAEQIVTVGDAVEQIKNALNYMAGIQGCYITALLCCYTMSFRHDRFRENITSARRIQYYEYTIKRTGR